MAEIEAGKEKAVADIQQKREEMVYEVTANYTVFR